VYQANQVRTVAASIANPEPKVAIPTTAHRKHEPRLPLRMPPIGLPNEIEKLPGEGKATWLRRRMGIPVDMPLKDQNTAASAFYSRVKLLSQQELDCPFTWYTTNGLSQDMIARVVAGMASHGWCERLARDVLMNICQRRCQNIKKRENEERRQLGHEIKLGRPKTIRHTSYENPMDFVSSMKAIPEDSSVTIQAKSTSQPQYQLEIVGSARQYRAKMGTISSNIQTNMINSVKRKRLEEPESLHRRMASFRNISTPPLFHQPQTPLSSSSRLRPVPSGSSVPSISSASHLPSVSSIHPSRPTPTPFPTTVSSNQIISTLRP